MKKIFKILSVFSILSCTLTGCNKNNNNTENESNKIDITRTSLEEIRVNTNNNNNKNENKTIEEKEISSFSTPLKSGVANRITNIKITCNKINGRVLKNGEAFSFNEIVGPCKAEEGYKKAEIYVNKKIAFALGGGNCQVSTTLYNAVLSIPGVQITERHEHNGRPVDYIEDGKDATVSYNTLDLKFVNQTGKDIKLYTWCDDVNVYARITELVYE